MTDPIKSPAPENRVSAPVSARQIAVVLGVISAVVLGAAVLGNLGGGTQVVADTSADVEATPTTTPLGTLGVTVGQVRDLWNEVSDPPRINQNLRRIPEVGELDSFFRQFDGASVLTGAYRDIDDYLVALRVEVGLGHPNVETMHVHLCHIVSAYSPECLDSFRAIGLGSLPFDEVRDSGISADWDYDGNKWRVNESGGVLIIRVIAPDVTG